MLFFLQTVEIILTLHVLRQTISFKGLCSVQNSSYSSPSPVEMSQKLTNLPVFKHSNRSVFVYPDFGEGGTGQSDNSLRVLRQVKFRSVMKSANCLAITFLYLLTKCKYSLLEISHTIIVHSSFKRKYNSGCYWCVFNCFA